MALPHWTLCRGNLGAEQVGILIVFLFSLTLIYAQRKDWTAVGILLALNLFKPHITALPAALAVLWLLKHERTLKPLLTMAGTLVTMFGISLLVTPRWYLALLDADKITGLSYKYDPSGAPTIIRHSSTLRDFLSVYGVEGTAFTFIYVLVGILCLAALAYGWFKSTNLNEFTSIAILANFAVIPYTLFYDYPSQTIPLLYAGALMTGHPR